MSSRFCPNCGSENVSEDESGFVCRDCDYSAKIFPQKELVGELADEDFDDEDDAPVIVSKPAKTVKKIVKKVVKKKIVKKKSGGKKK